MRKTWFPRCVRSFVLSLVCTAALLALVGCGSGASKGEFAGPDWSRARLLGTANINNRPAIAWHPASKSAVVAWLSQAEGTWRFQWAVIGNQGEVATKALAVSLHQPSYPKLHCDHQGTLHLFWLDREHDGGRGIYHAQFSVHGEASSGPQRVSPTGSDVSGYTVAEALPGALDVLWSDVTTTPPALHHARIATSGAMLLAPHTLAADAEHPACAVDTQGMIHLTWHRTGTQGEERVFYATFDPQTLVLTGPALLAAVPGGTGLVVQPPEVGLDREYVYVFWSQERRAGGLTSGTAQTFGQVFPIAKPDEHKEGRLDIPGLARPQYVSMRGAFNYEYLAYPGEVTELPGVYADYIYTPSVPSMEYGAAGAAHAGVDSDSADTSEPPADVSDSPKSAPVVYHLKIEYTCTPYFIPGQREEVGIVVGANVALSQRAEGVIQTVLAVLQSGKWKGLQVAALTRSSSSRPIAVADDTGALHLAWLDAGGFGRYEVWYASTSPSVRQALNRLTAEDVLAALANRAWTMTAAFSFLPVLMLWLILPLTWLVAIHFVQPDIDLYTRAGRVGLGVTVLLYLLSKMFAVPAFLASAPLLDVVRPEMRDLVLFGLPALLAALGLLAMTVYIVRSQRKAVWVAFLWFAVTDSVLSLVLYVPTVIGV